METDGQERLNLYQIDMKYIRNLHRADDNVSSVSPQIGKHHRIYVGISVFDKGIITRHLKNGANLHQTAAIGENSKRRFLRDMAGVHWGPPCFGYQGGPQQTPAIPAAKYKYQVVTSRQNVPKQSLSPRIFT